MWIEKFVNCKKVVSRADRSKGKAVTVYGAGLWNFGESLLFSFLTLYFTVVCGSTQKNVQALVPVP